MNLHPLGVKRILHIDSDDTIVRADWRNVDLVLVTSAGCLGVSLRDRIFANDLKYQVAAFSEGFCRPPGEILKTEFMEPMGVSGYELAKALSFPGIYEIVRGERAISADTTIRLGKYFGLPAQFWLNLQNHYDLRIAVGRGVGRKIKLRKVEHDRKLTGLSRV